MTKQILIILIFFASFVYAQSIRDFVLIENPTQLTIYNKYKQPISEKEKKLFTSFKPLQIVKRSGVFNDAVRGYMEIELNNSTFFIVKLADGDYYGKKASGEWFFYEDSKTFYDTIKIERKIEYTNVKKNKTGYLEKDELLVRIFESGKEIYCKVTKSNKYVWIKNSKDDGYIIINNKIKVSKDISGEIKNKISQKFYESNALMEKIVSYFNKETNKNNKAPKWVVDYSKKEIIAKLSNSDKNFDNSTRYLANQIENIILGTGLKLKTESNIILIGY